MEEKENSSIRNRRKSSFFQKQLHLVDGTYILKLK